MKGADLIRCVDCGDVIGSYEPLVVVVDRAARETSLAAEPQIPIAGAEHYHAACFSGPQRPASGDPTAVVPMQRGGKREEREANRKGSARRRGLRRLAG